MREHTGTTRGWSGWLPAGVLAVLAGGCAPGMTGTGLPPVPRVDEALELRVSYPRDSALVETRGNNFIFGSTGSGEARLWINDREVEVRSNGAFLAFIPVPQDGLYRLRATRGGATATLEVPIRLPPALPAPADTPQIVDGTPYPAGAWVAQPGERIEVGFRGTPGGVAWLVLPGGDRIPLVQDAAVAARGATDFEVGAGTPAAEPAPFAWYRGFFNARRLVTADTLVAWPALTGEGRPVPEEGVEAARERAAGAPTLPPGGVGAGYVELAVGDRTVRRALALNLLLADPDRPRVGVGYDPPAPEGAGTGRVIGRPGPGGGPFHYIWANGTELELTGERNGTYQVRLADGLTAWGRAGEIALRPPGAPPPVSRVGVVRLTPHDRYIDVRVGLSRRLPYAVEEGDRSLTLLVFGATSRANFLQHGRTDPYIERAEWSQPEDRIFRLDIHLSSMPWGYEVFYGEGTDLVLRIRRPPVIDRRNPLRGLTIGVDPGHGGADRFTMGPTGFTEADANLGIALEMQRLLERAGARVVMTRTTDTTVSLVRRTDIARENDVDVLISVHNNAFPDGVNPFENHGTIMYYTHPRAAGLAWLTQEEVLTEFGLPDLGVGRADFHLPRFTWAPSILSENMFMMIPEQEAALRRPDVQRRLAQAQVRALVRWLTRL